MRRLSLCVLAAGLALSLATGQAAARDVKIRMKRAQEVPMVVEKVPDTRKLFGQVVMGMEKIEGLFTFYWDEESGNAYMEIKPEQLGKVYLCSITREAAEAQIFDSAAQLRNFPFVFVKAGHTIQFVHKNVRFRADPDKPVAKALERGISDSIVGSATMVSQPNPDGGGFLVSPDDFFLQDIGHVGLYTGHDSRQGGFSFDKGNSRFVELKSFPNNCEIETSVHFVGRGTGPTTTLPEATSMIHRYHFSLSTLPETDYRPRLADDRVGYFTTMYQDYNDMEKETAYVRYINRWHLEKQDSLAAVSPPKEPIVFWLENTIPIEYRQTLKEGILMWNEAFESAGFKDAIVVKQMPDSADWDPADSRYNTVRWMVRPGGYYAAGPSRTNPFTGQIYDADIRVSADMVRAVYKSHADFVDPLSMLREFRGLMEPFRGLDELNRPGVSWDPGPLDVEGDVPSGGIGCAEGICTYQYGKSREAAFGLGLLAARGFTDGADSRAESYIRDYLREMICHEVGHTLGLRHNFKASTMRTLEEMQQVGITSKDGLMGSVMEYNPVNLSRKGERQGEYFQSTLGPYDIWAIEYGYKPIEADSPEGELDALNTIASRASEKDLAYGTDEDSFGFDPRGIDPTCNVWDLGADPIRYYQRQVDLTRELWSSVQDKFDEPGVRYPKLRGIFGRGVRQYLYAGLNCSKYVGGIYARRDHVGDPGGRSPMEPVPADAQRAALRFLTENFFAADAFRFDPALLNKLAPERLPSFESSPFSEVRLDYPIHNAVLAMQAAPLVRIYHPVTLSRLQDLELHYAAGQTPFTMQEMFTTVRDAVWSELSGARSINSFRRELQRLHLGILMYYVVTLGEGAPQDACTLARADLTWILRGVDRALAGTSIDPMTRAHLEETKARIEAALDAGIQRVVG